MPRVDDFLHQQLISPALWEAPHPTTPLRRVQQCYAWRDGSEVADWLYAQGDRLAFDRMTRWLQVAADTLQAGHPVACDALVQQFRERALAYLWDHLERQFESQVAPVLAAAQHVRDTTACLQRAAATFVQCLVEVHVVRLAATSLLWQWLQSILPAAPAPTSDLRDVSSPQFVEHLLQALTQHEATLPTSELHQLTHKAVALAKTLAAVLEADWERLQVRALLTTPGGGTVRDLWIYAKEESGGDMPVTHNLVLERTPEGAFTAASVALENSLRHAVQAACQYLHQEYLQDCQPAVHLYLEASDSPEVYKGPSLGLAVALALIARLRQCRVNRQVAVTGLVHADGTLTGVEGITEKLQGVVEHNARVQGGLLADVCITDVVLPADNRGGVDVTFWQARGVTLHFAATLREAVLDQVLLNPWEGLCSALSASVSRIVPSLKHVLAGVEEVHRAVFLCPYATSSSEILQTLAGFWALKCQRRQQSPVPVLIKLLPFAREGVLEQQVLHQVQTTVASEQAEALDMALVLRQLRRAGFLLLFDGLDELDKSDAPPTFLRDLLAQLSNPPHSRNAAVFVCRQSTWEWVKGIFTQAVPPFLVHALYTGHSTLLDTHLQALLREATGRLGACRIGSSYGTDDRLRRKLPSPEEFFYGGSQDVPTPLYLDVHVREVARGDAASESQSVEQLVARSNDWHRALLLGEGGTGKSTELLKLVFDCCSPRSASPLRDVYAPMFIELRGKFDRRGGDTYEAFLERVLDDLRLTGSLSVTQCQHELRYTPRLLVLLDGLDEVKPEGIQARDHIAELLWRFTAALHPSSWVMLASRAQERQRAHESVLYALERQPGQWRIWQVDDLALDEACLRCYLHSVTQSPSLTEALLTALGGRLDVLKNPMLVHLFSSVAPQKLAGRPLNRGTIYRAALETWLEEEIHAQGKPRLAGIRAPTGKTLLQVMMGLLGVLAHGMVEDGMQELHHAEARTVLAQFVAQGVQRMGKLPGWWPLTDDAQRHLGIDGGQVQVDELDVIVQALGELCVMR